MRRWLLDTAERAAWTAFQAFVATLSLSDLSTARTAGIAAVGAFLSVLKSAVAAKIPGTISPASVVYE